MADRFHGHQGTPARLPLQVLVAGIEANIPVTMELAARGDTGTGCQFIGQSPVHSLLAAC